MRGPAVFGGDRVASHQQCHLPTNMAEELHAQCKRTSLGRARCLRSFVGRVLVSVIKRVC